MQSEPLPKPKCGCGRRLVCRGGVMPAQCRLCRLKIVKLPALKCACGRRIWQRRGREPQATCVICRRTANAKTYLICKCGRRVQSGEPGEKQCSSCRPHYTPVSGRHVPPARFEKATAENVFQAMYRGAR